MGVAPTGQRLDAAAIAATHGSVSAVTFITATQYLDNRGVVLGAHGCRHGPDGVPAILIAIVLSNWLRRSAGCGPIHSLPTAQSSQTTHKRAQPHSLRHVLHESDRRCTTAAPGGHASLASSAAQRGKRPCKPFAGDLFKGMLAFFLLDMGLLAAAI